MVVEVNIRVASRIYLSNALAVGIDIFRYQIGGFVVFCKNFAIHPTNVIDHPVILDHEIIISRRHAEDVQTKVAIGVGVIVVVDLQSAIDIVLDVRADGINGISCSYA